MGVYTASYEHEFGRSTDTLIPKKSKRWKWGLPNNKAYGVNKKIRWKRISKRSTY